MLLHTYDPAPNPRRLRLFLDYKGIALDTRQVNLRKHEQFEPAYRAINPRCIVPALQLDDGGVLCDALAIALYLESLHPERPLFGADALERARIVSWDQYLYSDAFQPIAETLRNEHPAFAGRAVTGSEPAEQIPALAERGRRRLPAFWRALDQALAGREFLVGDQPSFADIDALVMIEFAGWIKETVPEDCAQLHRWRARVAPLFGGAV